MTRAAAGFESRSQNDHVRVDVKLLIEQQVGRLNLQFSGRPVRGDLADRALDVMHVVLLHRPAIELVEELARRADVDVEDVDVGIRIMILRQDRVLRRVHAADL